LNQQRSGDAVVRNAVEQRVIHLTVITLIELLETRAVFPFGVFRDKEPENLLNIMAVCRGMANSYQGNK
jgi:hypothetical protein